MSLLHQQNWKMYCFEQRFLFVFCNCPRNDNFFLELENQLFSCFPFPYLLRHGCSQVATRAVSRNADPRGVHPVLGQDAALQEELGH